ncbi:MAG: YqhA family protein [Nanoarchaeota archaeon]
MRYKRSLIERIFEKSLWASRFLVIIAVISTLISSFFLFILGSYGVIKALYYFLHITSNYSESKIKLITYLISSVDIFLIAMVLLIFSIGVYELFISKIEELEKDERSSKVLKVHSLDELKEKIAKVIIMVLLVVFFKSAMEINYGNIKDLTIFSITILVISLAYYLLSKSDKLENKD